jgi:hypothetical protein
MIALYTVWDLLAADKGGAEEDKGIWRSWDMI